MLEREMLTPREAAYIRLELQLRLGVIPRLRNGILLKNWKAGPMKGCPRLPSAIASLIERGLVEVRKPDSFQPSRAYFTSLGIASITAAVQNSRVFPPDRYGHLLRELLHDVVE